MAERFTCPRCGSSHFKALNVSASLHLPKEQWQYRCSQCSRISFYVDCMVPEIELTRFLREGATLHNPDMRTVSLGFPTAAAAEEFAQQVEAYLDHCYTHSLQKKG